MFTVSGTCTGSVLYGKVQYGWYRMIRHSVFSTFVGACFFSPPFLPNTLLPYTTARAMVLGGGRALLGALNKILGSLLHRLNKQHPSPRLTTTTHVDDVVQTEKVKKERKNGDKKDIPASTRRHDGTASSSSSSSTTSSRAASDPRVEEEERLSWGDLPECCVERILLGAGFQSALSATACDLRPTSA